MRIILKYSFFLICIFVFGVNLFFLYKNFKVGNFLEQNITGDALHYLEIAKNINSFGVYSDNNSFLPSESATWRPPFFPYLLSVFLIFTKNILSIVVLKFLFQTFLILYGFYHLYKNNLISRPAFNFGVLILIEPYYLKYSYSLLSESLSASLLFLFVCFSIVSLLRGRGFFETVFLGFLSIINHPVVLFFVLIILGLVFFKIVIQNKFLAFKFSVFFISLILIWPIRNFILFDKGIYLTASQGATFSKGWNERVIHDFNNVDGDLADESLNLNYLISKPNLDSVSVLELSKLYKSATINFIKSNGWKENLAIAGRKVLSNFNPFPEKSKPGLLELSASFFRCIYLLFLVVPIVSFIFFKVRLDVIYFIYISVYLSQMLMSVIIYTGLRFNSPYSLVLFGLIILRLSILLNRVKSKTSSHVLS